MIQEPKKRATQGPPGGRLPTTTTAVWLRVATAALSCVAIAAGMSTTALAQVAGGSNAYGRPASYGGSGASPYGGAGGGSSYGGSSGAQMSGAMGMPGSGGVGPSFGMGGAAGRSGLGSSGTAMNSAGGSGGAGGGTMGSAAGTGHGGAGYAGASNGGGSGKGMRVTPPRHSNKGAGQMTAGTRDQPDWDAPASWRADSIYTSRWTSPSDDYQWGATQK